jgi:hypothetical protein
MEDQIANAWAYMIGAFGTALGWLTAKTGNTRTAKVLLGAAAFFAVIFLASFIKAALG